MLSRLWTSAAARRYGNPCQLNRRCPCLIVAPIDGGRTACNAANTIASFGSRSRLSGDGIISQRSSDAVPAADAPPVEGRARPDLSTLPVDRRVKVAGLVLLRQRPSTAKGITFVTLEDETGIANLIVPPEIWERYHQVARTATAMLAHGHLQRQDNVIHVLVTRLQDLLSLLADLESNTRDFR